MSAIKVFLNKALWVAEMAFLWLISGLVQWAVGDDDPYRHDPEKWEMMQDEDDVDD